MAKLYYTYGAMNSGKSTALLQAAHNYEERGMHVAVLKPSVDTKGGDAVVSRLGISRAVDATLAPDDDAAAVAARVMAAAEASGRPVACVLVDEAQFLTARQARQLHALAHSEGGVPCMCYGLRTDFRGEPFEGAATLLSLADKTHEYKTVCSCGRKATMNLRVDAAGSPLLEGDSLSIDGASAGVSYVPVCADCYYREVGAAGRVR